MAKRYVVRLTDEQRTQLKKLLAKKRLAAQKRKRAQILLKADSSKNGPGWSDTQIAEAFDVTVVTVENVRKRCILEGLDAAIERKKQCRPSRQRVLDGEKEARLVALCCSKAPAGHARWTLRMLADELVELNIVDSISYETVRTALKKRIAALAAYDVVHSAGPQRRIRLCDGDGIGSLSPSV